MIENGKAANGSPLQRIIAAVGESVVGTAKPLAGDVLDVCAFVGDDEKKTFAKLVESATAAIEKENRTGASVAVKVDALRSLIEAALAKK